MLELKTYSKKELGKLLNVSYSRTDIITKKLKKMGYEFKTSGRGDNYSIEITLIPDLSLKKKEKNEFNIDVRFPDRLAHFINLLLSPIGSDLLGMNARTISHFTKLSDELIKDYLEAFISCGLLEKHCCEESYYATKRKNNEDMAPNGDYTYFYLAKIITKDEYQKAYNAFYSSYNSDTKDIDNNPDMVIDLAILNANGAKKEALDGWWACTGLVEPLTINRLWPQFPTLLELLKNYPYEEYRKNYKSNYRTEELAREEKWAKIEAQLEEKRMYLEEKKKMETTINEQDAIIRHLQEQIALLQKQMVPGPSSIGIPIVDEKKEEDEEKEEIKEPLDIITLLTQETITEKTIINTADNNKLENTVSLNDYINFLNQERKAQ